MNQDPRIADAIPAAAALICAVADDDQQTVNDVFHGLDAEQLQALAIVLAASADADSPLLGSEPSVEHIIDRAVTIVARRWRVTIDAIFSTDRHRDVAEARQVAMAACRLAGVSSPRIGEAFGRDHSTVLHAATRVGEDARLRPIATGIASTLNRRGLLGDVDDEVAA